MGWVSGVEDKDCVVVVHTLHAHDDDEMRKAGGWWWWRCMYVWRSYLLYFSHNC